MTPALPPLSEGAEPEFDSCLGHCGEIEIEKMTKKITPAAIYRYPFLHSLSVHYGETLIGIPISQGPFWRIGLIM